MMDGLNIARIVDAVIAFTVVEGLVLAAFHRATGRGVAPREFALNLASGLFLMFALRCLVGDAGANWIALCLLAAGAAHGTDLWRRWQHASRRTPMASKGIA